MAFRVGQKVVCVDTRLHQNGRLEAARYLTQGAIYQIRWVGLPAYEPDQCGGICVRLVGITRPNHPRPEFSDYPFGGFRFRPVVSTDIGMAILEQIRRDVSNKILRPIFEDEQV